jgi:hypothetical protein
LEQVFFRLEGCCSIQLSYGTILVLSFQGAKIIFFEIVGSSGKNSLSYQSSPKHYDQLALLIAKTIRWSAKTGEECPSIPVSPYPVTHFSVNHAVDSGVNPEK